MFGIPLINDKKWPSDKIINLCPIKQYDGEPSKKDNLYWLLNLDMIENDTGMVIKKIYLSKEDIGSSIITFSKDNVLYSKLRPYLNKVVVPDQDGYATSELVPFCPTEKINKLFFAHFLRSTEFVKFIDSKSCGAKMPRAPMDILKQTDLYCPPISLQNQFAEFVEHLDKSKIANDILEAA